MLASVWKIDTSVGSFDSLIYLQILSLSLNVVEGRATESVRWAVKRHSYWFIRNGNAGNSGSKKRSCLPILRIWKHTNHTFAFEHIPLCTFLKYTRYLLRSSSPSFNGYFNSLCVNQNKSEFFKCLFRLWNWYDITTWNLLELRIYSARIPERKNQLCLLSQKRHHNSI